MPIFGYDIFVVGDCNNTSSGQFSLNISGTSPPYSINWVSPSGVTFPSGTISSLPYELTGLSAGTYTFNLTDSSLVSNSGTSNISFVITSSSTINLNVINNTSCGNNNGTILAYTPVNYGTNTIKLYKDGEFVVSAQTSITNTYFRNLQPGVYYATVEDFGGCLGTSDSVIIHDSESLDFDLYVVDNPACLLNNGKIYVTGITGTPPFTYTWSNNVPTGQTSFFVTGLTRDVYSVTVRDYFGCELTKTASVGNADYIGLVSYSVIQPTCLQSDGSITFRISGGSAPYYYLLSNGDSIVSYSDIVTFSGLSSGLYFLNISDVSLCTFRTNVSLSTPNTFSVITTNTVDSLCGYRNGEVSVELNGGSPPYFVSLINSQGTIINKTSTLNTISFTNLSSDTYNILVRDSFSACTYSGVTTVNNNPSYDFIVNTSGTTCGNQNGIVQVVITTANTTADTYTYSLSNGLQSSITTATTYTFTGVSAGNYEVSVTNSQLCKQIDFAIIDDSTPYKVFLYPSNCINGSDGTIQVLINETDGPFNLTWSNNVTGQTGMFITGLTAGTYYLTVSGESGCQQVFDTSIECTQYTATTRSYLYSSGDRTFTPSSKLSLKNMMYSGYTSLVSNAQNCILNSAKFSIKVTIDSVDYQFPFYYTTSFDRIPTLSYFSNILENSILSIPYIVDCTVDAVNGSIQIESEVVGGIEYYKDDTITFDIVIEYDISCLSINNVVCP